MQAVTTDCLSRANIVSDPLDARARTTSSWIGGRRRHIKVWAGKAISQGRFLIQISPRDGRWFINRPAISQWPAANLKSARSADLQDSDPGCGRRAQETRGLNASSEHEILTQFCFDVGPTSETVAQHKNNIGSKFRVCWDAKWNESGFRPPLCTYRLNWARRTFWGWWDDWDDTALQTQNSKFKPWRSEAEHATSRSRRLPTILTFTRGWGRNIFCFFQTAETGNRTPDSGVKGSGANHYPRAHALLGCKQPGLVYIIKCNFMPLIWLCSVVMQLACQAPHREYICTGRSALQDWWMNIRVSHSPWAGILKSPHITRWHDIA